MNKLSRLEGEVRERQRYALPFILVISSCWFEDSHQMCLNLIGWHFLRKRPLLTFTKSLVRYLKENEIKSLGIITGNTLLKIFERRKRRTGQPTTAQPDLIKKYFIFSFPNQICTLYE